MLAEARNAEVETERRTATDSALLGAYRSGYFTRQVLTSFGTLPALHVPKLRTGNRARAWRILQR